MGEKSDKISNESGAARQTVDGEWSGTAAPVGPSISNYKRSCRESRTACSIRASYRSAVQGYRSWPWRQAGVEASDGSGIRSLGPAITLINQQRWVAISLHALPAVPHRTLPRGHVAGSCPNTQGSELTGRWTRKSCA